MKTFIIILVFVTSALAALLYTLDMPGKSESPVNSPAERPVQHSLYSKIEENFNLSRRIYKEGDISEIKSFQNESLELISELNRKSLFPETFVQDYSRLLSIVNDTAEAIQSHNDVLYTHLLKIKDRMPNFEKKIKSIGLGELNKSWRMTQKSFHEFHRSPSETKFKEYLQQHQKTKAIITELYLDDDQEAYLFGYLEEHNKAFRALYEVYNEVNFERIHELKPLMYGLKEQMELRSPQLKHRS